MKCPACERDFPKDMIHDLIMGSERYPRCPLCALKERNLEWGLPEETPFHGPQARALHAQAIEHLKATNQPV